MTIYEIIPHKVADTVTWAVIAIGTDGKRRFVQQYVDKTDAETKLMRLQGMARACLELAEVP